MRCDWVTKCWSRRKSARPKAKTRPSFVGLTKERFLIFVTLRIHEVADTLFENLRVEAFGVFANVNGIEFDRFKLVDGLAHGLGTLVVEEHARLAFDNSFERAPRRICNHRATTRLSLHGGKAKIFFPWKQ